MLVNPGPSRLHASTVWVDDPGSLTKFMCPEDACFIRRNEGFVALGEVARWQGHSMLEADQWWRELSSRIENESEMPGQFNTGPLAVGSFCFSPEHTQYRSTLIIPETIIGRRDGRCWLTKIGYDTVVTDLPRTAPAPAEPPQNPHFTAGNINASQWIAIVEQMTEKIKTSQLRKVVMAREIQAIADTIIDPRWVTRRLMSEYGSCWNFAVAGLVGATPEMVVRRERGLITSRVLAGTVPQVDGIYDMQQARNLVSSPKDLEEHRLAVESVVTALRGCLLSMNVPEAPYVLSLPNVLHLVTDICGVSDPDISTLQLAAAIHPSAAVCGLPTDAARQLIADNEMIDRGRYAGPVGWIDAQGDGEWALALRCGQIDADDGRKMKLYAGGGIVAASDPNAELTETEAKFEPMKAALRQR